MRGRGPAPGAQCWVLAVLLVAVAACILSAGGRASLEVGLSHPPVGTRASSPSPPAVASGASLGTSATLSVSPVSGSVGTSVSYRGAGFDPDASITVSGPLSTTACSATSDAQGDFQCSAPLPAVPQGSYTVSATDGTNVATFSPLTVLPDLLDHPAQGPVGADVTFRGYGWNQSDSVSVLWNGSSVCWVRAATNGSFACPTYTVPTVEAAVYPITANDLSVRGGLSASTSFTVLPGAPLALGAPDLEPRTVDQGQVLVLLVNVTGGSGGVAFTWSGLPPGCSGSDTATLECRPTSIGDYTVRLNATDSIGERAESPAAVVAVVSEPFVGSVEASRLAVDVGETVNLSVSAVGGVAPYSYLWLGLPPGCAGTTASLSCVPTASGSFALSVDVTDGDGVSVDSSGLFLAVDPAFSIGAVHATSPTTDAGEATTFYAIVTGGAGGDAYLWSGLPLGCATSSAPSLVCDPEVDGTFHIRVNATDANGEEVAAAPLTYRIYASFFTLSYPTESRITLDLGQSVVFTVNSTGGESPYFYNWSDTPTGCPNVDSWTLACVPTSTGSWWVSVEVTDQTGWWWDTDGVQLIVTSALEPPSLVANPGTVSVGQSLTLGVAVTGGTDIYSYFWTNLPPGCAPLDQSTITCAPTVPGTFDPTVSVFDSNGDNESATTAVTVNSAPGFSLSDVPWLTLVEGAVIVLAVLGVLVLLVRRRGPRSSFEAEEEFEEDEEAELPVPPRRSWSPAPKRPPPEDEDADDEPLEE